MILLQTDQFLVHFDLFSHRFSEFHGILQGRSEVPSRYQ
jgi:hypothetical protein